MKKSIIATLFLFVAFMANAQFGYVKKADLEKFKDSRIVVVLFGDSAYNASIQTAVEKYWTFNSGFIFAPDTALKPYMNKPEYSFLVFSKSKASKLKIKVCSAEEDVSGLLLCKKFKRKVLADDMIATAFCGNKMDTADWYPELVRGVQLLNNFCSLAIEGNSDREITAAFMMSNYPTNKAVMNNLTLMIDPKEVEIKSSEDIGALWGGEVEEIVDKDEVYKAILSQDPNKMYYYSVLDEKYCNKLFVTAAGSELMYFTSTGKDKCKCTAKDLKALKQLKDKASN